MAIKTNPHKEKIRRLQEKNKALRARLKEAEATLNAIREGEELGPEFAQRKRTETGLRDSEVLIPAVLAETSDPIYVKDRNSRILLVNPALAKVVGKPLRNSSGEAIGILGISHDTTDRRRAEKALSKSEERFNLAVKAARGGVWDWNMETDEVWYSPRYKEMLGYSENEIEHHVSAWLRLLHPDDKERALGLVDAVMRGEKDYEIEFRLRHKDGHYLDILSRGFPVRREVEGRIIRIVGIHFDLTERKQAEKALRESEELYRQVAENTTAIIFRVTPGGVITYANGRALEFFGYTADELIGKHAVGTIVPQRETSGRDLASMVDEIASDPDRFHTNANENICKNGRRVWVEWTNSGIYDANGRLKEFLVVGIDATDRRQAEAALRESEENYRHIVEYAPTGIYEIEYAGPRLTRVNDAMCRILGYTREELLALKPMDMLDKESQVRFRERIRKVLAGEKVDETVSFKVIAKNGREIWAALNVRMMYEGDEVKGALVVAHDITERKRMEEELRRSRDELELRVQERTAQLQESESRLRVLASDLINAQETERKRIAHELHDSLAAQLAAIKYRLERKLNEQELPDLTITLEEIIQDVQRATAETRRIMANLRPSVLDDLGIIAALSWYCREAQKTYPKIMIQYVGNIKEEEVPDALKIVLFRVVEQSLTNAIRHGKPRRVLISLNRIHSWLRLQVEDNGKGFDSMKLGEKNGNSGIGLDSMQQRVNSTGGIFSITSSPGQGTTVKAEWKIV